MRIEFEDERLAIIRTPKAHRLGLPVAVIRSCRDKLLVIEAATTEQTLKNMRSLDYKKWKSSDEMQIRLNDQYRMRFQTRRNDGTADRLDHLHWRPTLK